ncbi:MAG: hypothetical protein A3G49_04430 [Candidatus Sungbacteria bacterium RIFCSPLOWO2_12_FULL_41_11]|uniref:Permease n=1 Tax=Candidatus Sungbacteria bacterium RIFCSPLOWO2_12_FULL_41_11 TaxID=1802286 RepID=A0A1G2LQ00_9BACT|nr:MAG: Permease [Parcubacteria group bacterium GW2011_GWA2_42_14]OHA12922.1 MAG: hypothetical protein A3G49_04430 [Candidatus Sungbacteria bacterium RIFCSPLOWO2_12_FULL_41_11]
MPVTFIPTLLEYAGAILPWLVFGSFIAYAVERRVSKERIKKYFGTATVGKFVFAQILGMISPLSIMSQLPVAGSLVKLGAHPGLLLSFFVAERAYDLQSFPIIIGLFGLKFAVLNAAAIFLSLLIAALAVRNLSLTVKSGAAPDYSGFWTRQGKIAGVVVIGIIIGAALRALAPENAFREITHEPFGGILTALAIGFVLYFGTILGNYPTAKAFADLGMHPAGVFAFMTVSPVFNIVIMFLFASAIQPRFIFRQFGIYAITALLLTVASSLLL